MNKNNFKVKEIITFEDRANAIEYICNSLFDFNEEGEITDYSPYYIEPAQVCAILNYFVEGIEFESGESVYDVAVADKEVNDIINQFFLKSTTTAKNPKLTYPQEVMKFVMSHVLEKVEYMKQKAIHAPSYRKDMVGEAIVEFINVLSEKTNELNVSEANKFIEKYNAPDKSMEDIAKQFMKEEFERRTAELESANKNTRPNVKPNNEEKTTKNKKMIEMLNRAMEIHASAENLPY